MPFERDCQHAAQSISSRYRQRGYWCHDLVGRCNDARRVGTTARIRCSRVSLASPKEFYQAGRISFVPHNIYANMPLGAEMHTLAAMTIWQQQDTWWGGLVGKSITAAISVIGAVLLGGWIAQRLGSFSGWTAAGVWLGTPGITHVATLGLIDGVLATYVLATALVTGLDKVSIQRCICGRTEASARRLSDDCFVSGGYSGAEVPGLIYATLPCWQSSPFMQHVCTDNSRRPLSCV